MAFTWKRAMKYELGSFMAPTKFVRAGELIYAVDGYSDE